jgi:hypothetical protein
MVLASLQQLLLYDEIKGGFEVLDLQLPNENRPWEVELKATRNYDRQAVADTRHSNRSPTAPAALRSALLK